MLGVSRGPVKRALELLAEDRLIRRFDGRGYLVGEACGQELAQDVLFWRQHSLADAIHHELQISTVVIDLDGPLDGFLKHIEPLLASPYRDELGGIAGLT